MSLVSFIVSFFHVILNLRSSTLFFFFFFFQYCCFLSFLVLTLLFIVRKACESLFFLSLETYIVLLSRRDSSTCCVPLFIFLFVLFSRSLVFSLKGKNRKEYGYPLFFFFFFFLHFISTATARFFSLSFFFSSPICGVQYAKN